MSEQTKHVARRKRMNTIDVVCCGEQLKVRSKYRKKSSVNRAADEELLQRCRHAYRRKIKRDHECTCCDPGYFDDLFISDDGIVHVRWNADHPNDIRDDEIGIDILLEAYDE